MREAGYRQQGFVFARSLVDLHAMIASCGYARETSTSYDWDGLKRGEAEFAILQYTLNGSGELIYEQRSYAVAPGQAMLVHIPHCHRYRLPSTSSHWEFLYVVMYGRDINRICGDIEKLQGPIPALSDTHPVVTHLAELVYAGAYEGLHDPYTASLQAYAVTMHLARHFLGQERNDTQSLGTQRACAFAQKHFAESIGVDEMAAAAGMSRYHFSRRFKAEEGVAPGEYLREMRLKKALLLLEDSSRSIKEVATESGFCDTTYFCKVFTKRIGTSPGAFRRNGVFGQT